MAGRCFYILLLFVSGIVACGGDEDKRATQNPPTIMITSPNTFSTHIQGDAIQFSCTAEDTEDGSLSDSSVVWISNIDGQIGSGKSFTKVLSAGLHNIEVTATDSQGASYTESFSVIITSIVETE
jgi:hypothetical protein